MNKESNNLILVWPADNAQNLKSGSSKKFVEHP